MIHSAKFHRRVAWLGIVAILLIALAPTVSRLRAAAGDAHHAWHAAALSHEAAGTHHHGGDPDDCWSRCGYCNLLTHTPAIGTIHHVAPLIVAAAPVPLATASTFARAHDAFFPAAQPRGPPRFA